MFGPLGFNEIIFILVLGFLLLGPRQLALFSRTFGEMLGRFYRATADARRLFEEERRKLEEDVAEVTAPVRQAKEGLRSLRGELQKDVAEVERQVKKEKSYFERRQTEMRQDWSRRKFLGDLDDEPAEDQAGEPGEDVTATLAVPEIRSPEGQMARGGLPEPPSSEAEVSAASTAATSTASGEEPSSSNNSSAGRKLGDEEEAKPVTSP